MGTSERIVKAIAWERLDEVEDDMRVESQCSDTIADLTALQTQSCFPHSCIELCCRNLDHRPTYWFTLRHLERVYPLCR